MKDSINMVVTYDYGIADVWQALADPKAMSEWLMPCDIEAVVGHAFQFRTKPSPGFDGIVNCKVVEVKERELLSFTWSGGALTDTLVSFRLEAVGEKTKLTFEHKGFSGFLNKLIVRKILENGWKKKILVRQLPEFLSHG